MSTKQRLIVAQKESWPLLKLPGMWCKVDPEGGGSDIIKFNFGIHHNRT